MKCIPKVNTQNQADKESDNKTMLRRTMQNDLPETIEVLADAAARSASSLHTDASCKVTFLTAVQKLAAQ